METLMELVNDCKKFTHENYLKHNQNSDIAQELRKLGFTHAASTLQTKSDLKMKLGRVAEFGYITVTDAKIRKFLKAKADRYDKKHRKTARLPSNGLSAIFGSPLHQDMQPVPMRAPLTFSSSALYASDAVPGKNYSISAPTIDRGSYEEGTIGHYAWEEVPVKDYRNIPPVSILDTFKEHSKRNLFDEFTIASVESIHDPLLLGRMFGHDDRWFIAQWGDDVQIDDLM